jgi:hypothetical protein
LSFLRSSMGNPKINFPLLWSSSRSWKQDELPNHTSFCTYLKGPAKVCWWTRVIYLRVLSTVWVWLNLLSCLPTLKSLSNRRADRNKRAGLGKNSTLPAFLLSKLINEQGGIFCLLHEKLQAGWKENLINLSKHALLLAGCSWIKPIIFRSHRHL